MGRRPRAWRGAPGDGCTWPRLCHILLSRGPGRGPSSAEGRGRLSCGGRCGRTVLGAKQGCPWASAPVSPGPGQSDRGRATHPGWRGLAALPGLLRAWAFGPAGSGQVRSGQRLVPRGPDPGPALGSGLTRRAPCGGAVRRGVGRPGAPEPRQPPLPPSGRAPAAPVCPPVRPPPARGQTAPCPPPAGLALGKAQVGRQPRVAAACPPLRATGDTRHLQSVSGSWPGLRPPLSPETQTGLKIKMAPNRLNRPWEPGRGGGAGAAGVRVPVPGRAVSIVGGRSLVCGLRGSSVLGGAPGAGDRCAGSRHSSRSSLVGCAFVAVIPLEREWPGRACCPLAGEN